MLPTGHIALGYLTAYSFLKITKPEIDPAQLNQLLVLGAFFGFAPDLDEFWFFYKNRSLLVAPEEKYPNHRYYISHVPVIWLLAGLLIFIFSRSIFWQAAGMLLWFCSWSHFLADSIEGGILWLWPFSKKLYALKDREKKIIILERNFFRHTLEYLKQYTRKVSFYLEILIILVTIVILIY